jgi:hypothetical protein
VLNQEFENTSNQVLDVSTLAPGIYTLFFYVDSERTALKVTVY